MARYTHYVVVPLTGSLYMQIDSDDPSPSMDAIMEAVYEKEWNLFIESKDGVELGDSFEIHREVVRGNVCFAECREAEITDTEDNGEEE